MVVNLQLPVKIWIESHDGDPGACDVIVEMEDGNIYTSLFVTLASLQRQMELTHDLCKHVPGAIPAFFAVLDVPHIIVTSLDREFIEDTIDNLLAMEVFESVFTQVTDSPDDEAERTQLPQTGRRATQEVAAVVLSEVLLVQA